MECIALTLLANLYYYHYYLLSTAMKPTLILVTMNLFIIYIYLNMSFCNKNERLKKYMLSFYQFSHQFTDC